MVQRTRPPLPPSSWTHPCTHRYNGYIDYWSALWLLLVRSEGYRTPGTPPPPTQPALPPRPKAGTGGPTTGLPLAPPPPPPGPSPGWSRGRERRNGQWQGPRSRPTPPHPLNYQWSATETDGTLPAQRTGFNTLDNWGHKIHTQSKRIKYMKEKIKGSWPGICIQYTRLHVHTCISLRVQSLSETGKMTTKSCWPMHKAATCWFCLCIVQELCESRGGRPGLSVLTSLLVSVDVKNYWTVLRHWSQLVPNMSDDIWGH